MPDSVYTNAKIYTVNQAQPRADAVAIKNGNFLVVGSIADVESPAWDWHTSISLASTHDEADERISQWSEFESLRGFTMDGAECLGFGSSDKIGSIKKGKLADFIVLNQNIFDVPITELYLTRVERTVLGGNVVYTKK